MNRKALTVRRHSMGMWVGAMVAGVLLVGCTHTIAIRRNLVFSPTVEPLAVRVGLYVDPDSQAREIVWGRFGSKFVADMGAALEPNAIAAMEVVFKEVTPIDDLGDVPDGISRIIQLSLGPGSSMKGGSFSVSEHKATTQIVCVVTDRDGRQLSRLEVAETRGDRDMVLQDALQSAANDSLRAALDTLGLKLLGIRDVFEKAEAQGDTETDTE